MKGREKSYITSGDWSEKVTHFLTEVQLGEEGTLGMGRYSGGGYRGDGSGVQRGR